jgi:hypothetical protein
MRGGFQRSFAVDTVTTQFDALPNYAWDLDSNGYNDNSFARTLSNARQQYIRIQEPVDAAIAAGRFKLFVTLFSTDASFTNADGAWLTVSDGDDTGTFCGSLTDGFFVSDDGLSEERPVEFATTLPFFDDVRMPVTAGRIAFVVEGDRLVSGQLNGAFRGADIKSLLFPALARMFTRQLREHPLNDPLSGGIHNSIDIGGWEEDNDTGCGEVPNLPEHQRVFFCRGSDGECGVPKDEVIQLCEITTNYLVTNNFWLDVDLFDDEGRYRPTPGERYTRNPGADSLSMGVGFTAVQLP